MTYGHGLGVAACTAIKRLAYQDNPGLFEQPTSGMYRNARKHIDRARHAALIEADRKYRSLPKAERDKLRVG